MNATITLRDYLAKNKVFYIPNYQRGYVWGKRSIKGKDSVSYMIESLLNGYINNTDIFIQGVTVSENEKQIVLIDGQQRTTFFYLLLKYLGYKGNFSIHYIIRKKSNDFLRNLELLNIDYSEQKDEKFQDIFFFKKTLRLIEKQLTEKIDKETFLTYLLDRVKFLYIDIPESKAVKVFSMMNGNKAQMQEEELIKAELLRLSSLNDVTFEQKSEKEKYAIEWDNNMLRSRYAREWDKWLQWWNRKDVKSLFKTENVMGELISTFYLSTAKKGGLSYAKFRERFLRSQTPIDAKNAFYKLRHLQKQFEDAFNNPIIYNKVGAIIRVINNDKEAFIRWYFNNEQKRSYDELDKYYKYAFLGLTHNEIIEQNKNKFQEAFNKKFDEMYDCLNDDYLYISENKEAAFKFLLRLNIDEDNKQENGKGRKFDFSIWDNDNRGRSLEHIFPKSKVQEKSDSENTSNDNILYVEDIKCTITEDGEEKEFIASHHSIGNLVLLYKDDNSAFKDSSFEEKKNLFFKNNVGTNKDIFKSRHLLHTIYKFANAKWDGEAIARNKYYTLKEFKKYYGKQD